MPLHGASLLPPLFTSITTSAWVGVKYNALIVVVSYGHFSGPLSGVDISINTEDVKIPNQASWPRLQCHKQDITTVLYPGPPPSPQLAGSGGSVPLPPLQSQAMLINTVTLIYCLIRFGVLHNSGINPGHINYIM